MDWNILEQLISQHSDEAFTIKDKRSVGGGCINEAWKLSGQGRDWFVKLNQSSGLEMFEAEAAGLDEMLGSNSIRVPRPLFTDVVVNHACLVMEYIPLNGAANAAAMGEHLAAMHRHSNEQFGWYRDNTIGSTPQINTCNSDWVDFWRHCRLGVQTDLAARKGIGHAAVKACEQLNEHLGEFFTDYQPQPSLLHGDLWGGNAAYAQSGEPVVFDPACYYGDREADIAMTELFGGFGDTFSDAYQNAWPLDSGYKVRKLLYNQYHILNHYNLFGGAYGSQVQHMTEQLLALCR